MSAHKKFSISMNVVLLFAFVVILFLYLNKEPVKQIEYISSVSSNMTIQLEATGYYIGPPYNTATSDISPTICKGFISIGGYDIFTVAVDPKIIPLGSLLYIDSLGFGMASDIATEIKGMDVDIIFRTSSEALKWGRRKVNATVFLKKD